MIYNAAILRLDVPGPSTPAGSATFASQTALSCRCAVGEPTAKDEYTLAQLKELNVIKVQTLQRDFVGALLRAGIPAGTNVAVEMRLLIKPDKAAAAALYRVRQVENIPHGAGSVYVAFCVQD